MRILYASERPPYPFFIGGAARCAHQLLQVMANELSVVCAAVGSADYAVSSWVYPQPEEYAALGVRGVSLNQDRQASPSPASSTLSPSPSPTSGRGERGGAGEGNIAASGGTEHGGTIDCGYPVQVIPNFSNSLGSFIDAFKPDVVWAQLEGAREVLELAHEKSIQGLFYVHDAEFDPSELRAIADLDCHIVCSSGFLAEQVRRVIGRSAQLVYPASDWYFGTRADTQGYVTMINPYPVKGIATFLEIAKHLPQQKFLLVESWKMNDAALAALQDRLVQLPNVRFSHRVSDMRTIYTKTKLLLVPSMWEEGFGMVAVEAQSCGIPVIASARGGLPESVGDGGILIADYRNVEKWLDAIAMVLGGAYPQWMDQALQHAKSDDFAPSALARRFLAVCSAKAPRTTLYSRVMRLVLSNLERVPVLGKLLRQAN